MKTKLALIALAAFGGFAALANSASARHPEIRVGIGFHAPAPVAYCSPAPVYYAPPPAPVYYAPAPVVVDYRPRPAGCWREVVVKTWVPATYVIRRDWCGRPMRTIEPAHFAYRTERVWVSDRG